MILEHYILYPHPLNIKTKYYLEYIVQISYLILNKTVKIIIPKCDN